MPENRGSIGITFLIAIVGGVLGGAIGSKTAVLIGAYVPTFFYISSTDLAGDDTSDGYFFTCLFGTLLPGFCGLFAGGIVLETVHGISPWPR